MTAGSASPSANGVDRLVRQARQAAPYDPDGARLMLAQAEAQAGDARGWRAIGDAWHAIGDPQRGGRAHLAAVEASPGDPALASAAAALHAGRGPEAELAVSRHLEAHPTDVVALGMLAEARTQRGDLAGAEKLLETMLSLAPDFLPARRQLAVLIYRTGRWHQALAHAEALCTAEPSEVGHRNLKAAILARLGRADEAVALYRRSLADHPPQPAVWMSLGHLLKTVGRFDDSVAAYRRAVALAPGLGEAWWGLANLKTFRFAPAEEAAMRAELARPALGPHHRLHIEFALAKAREDADATEEAFALYVQANARRRSMSRYDPQLLTRQVEDAARVLTAGFFAGRPRGATAGDPIFIVGEPRSGSTLVEKMLASHPMVEGTAELPDLDAIARRLRNGEGGYLAALARLTAHDARALGEEYLAATRVQRRTDRPFFIDKLPANFAHWGLIELILPNARIVDVRRHPLACGLSCFRQCFASGNEQSYDLGNMGRHYRDYVAMMELADAALPGRIHRVIYEKLIADPETELRALAAAIGIGFDPVMLDFHRNERAVRTPSAQQVRLPLFEDGVDRWRAFDRWLGPLRAALGETLETWNR